MPGRSAQRFARTTASLYRQEIELLSVRLTLGDDRQVRNLEPDGSFRFERIARGLADVDLLLGKNADSPEVIGSFHQVDLADCELTGADLTGADLTRATAVQLDFRVHGLPRDVSEAEANRAARRQPRSPADPEPPRLCRTTADYEPVQPYAVVGVSTCERPRVTRDCR
jgi:hypothetical protein